MGPLGKVCDGRHLHLPWGRLSPSRFATPLETVYPAKLCEGIRDMFCKLIRWVPQPGLSLSPVLAKVLLSPIVLVMIVLLLGSSPAASSAADCFQNTSVCLQSKPSCPWRTRA